MQGKEKDTCIESKRKRSYSHLGGLGNLRNLALAVFLYLEL